MISRIKSILEGIVLIVIVLVLFQTFFEDFSHLAQWNWAWRKTLLIAGFCFDLFFTIEFLIRFSAAVYNGNVAGYLGRGRGWIDFLASLPLVLFNSGPAMLTLITGRTVSILFQGFLNILKVIKAVRIARILRLLRVLKIFKQIRYTDSTMAQRHVSRIIAISITTFVFVLFSFNIILNIFNFPSFDAAVNQRRMVAMKTFIYLGLEQKPATVENRLFFEQEKDLIAVKQGDKTIYSQYSDAYVQDELGLDVKNYQMDSFLFSFDQRFLDRMDAKASLTYFLAVVFLVGALLLLYSPHFAITVTDPINIMFKGMKDKTYNLEVKVNPRYQEDEVFKLSSQYNDVYLPMKDRAARSHTASRLELNINDIKKMMK